jgi:hypothetical protein
MSSFEQDRGQDSPLSRDGGATATYAPGQYQPSQMMPPYGYELRPRRVYPIETKPFFLTSEFVGAVLAIAGIAITAASSDSFGAWRAWILIAGITAAYMISRGIAKSGTRSHADDPREHLDMNWGQNKGDSSREGR